MNKGLTYFIDRIVETDEFWCLNYYMRSMKKAPHGGVEYVQMPNFYMKHRPTGIWHLYAHYENGIPRFACKMVEKALAIWDDCNVDLQELLEMCFDGDFWYVGFRILKPKKGIKNDSIILWNVLSNHLRFSDYFELDNLDEILCAFIFYLIEEKMIQISSVSEIKSHEKLKQDHNKYGLSRVVDVKFMRQGFLIEDKYYLYNMFLDNSIGGPLSETPLTIEIFNLIPDINIYMRCDELLMVPKSELLSTATVDHQRFRGISLLLEDINNLVQGKEIVVHYNPDTLNKLVLVVKKDEENGITFYHIVVEELWNPEKIKDDIVTTTYIHAKYSLENKAFKHIDFSINQYNFDKYVLKYKDTTNEKHVSIDEEADDHYKIWCIEGNAIDSKMWSALVSATLDMPFRKLVIEMFPDFEVTESEVIL